MRKGCQFDFRSCQFFAALATYAQAQDSGSEEDDIPRPHWVLRDKDGVAVEAMVSGTCGYDNESTLFKSCQVFEYGTVNDFPCVAIHWLGNRYINTAYELNTGKPDKCNYSGVEPPEFVQSILSAPPYSLKIEY